MEKPPEELNKLKVKNFPSSFSSDDKKNFVTCFGAVDVIVERDFIIAVFKNNNEATQFLKTFHQKEILEKRLRVEYYTRALETKLDPIPETSSIKCCNDYIVKWLSINSHLDFSQPPPPYLRYKYPKATREIIDSISMALESVPKFYTQVLHLMNKMNLPPPFTIAEVQRSKLEKRFETISCQTEISNVKGKKRIWSGEEFLSDESELASDDDNDINVKVNVPIKRPKKSLITMQNPAKRFLQIKNYPKSNRKDGSSGFMAFETTTSIQSRKITVNVPNELTKAPIEPMETSLQTDVQEKVQTKSLVITREDLALNRLTSDQLSILPVFKNYQPGEQSNKLYIKNLAKTVCEDDLQMIFGHFTKKSKDEIQIKLMQTGRMKGQAFITFSTPYDEEDLEATGERLIDKALKETNGYLLKDKPMVVMYGRNS